MDRYAEDVSANFRNFGPASRQCATFLGKPGQGFGQHAGACQCLVRTAPYRNSQSARSRRAYVRNTDIRRSDPGVSGLGRRNVRADHGRRTYVSATNDGDNRRARIAAISAFGNRKGGRAPAIRAEGPNPLQDYVIVVLGPECPLSVIRGHFALQPPCPLYPQKRTCAVQLGMSALGQKRTWRRSFDDLVCAGEQRLGDFEIYYQLKIGRTSKRSIKPIRDEAVIGREITEVIPACEPKHRNRRVFAPRS